MLEDGYWCGDYESLLGGGVVEPAVGELREVVDAAVAHEGPPAAYLLGTQHVDLHNLLYLGVGRRLIEVLALRSGYEAVSPELYAASGTRRVRLVAYAVD